MSSSSALTMSSRATCGIVFADFVMATSRLIEHPG
jgi:hypothetical protein